MTTFTTLSGNTFTTNEQSNYFYMIDTNGKKTRIKKNEFEAAQRENEIERKMVSDAAQAELDKEPCHVDRVTIECDFDGDTRFWTVRVNDKAVSNHYSYDEAKAEAAKLGKLEEMDEAQDPELEEIIEETGLEASDAELERNIRNEQKKPSKPRRSKDIAYEGNGVTLTAKQVDFIHHLPDTCFWEHGLDSSIFVDCLCDEIGGQFTEKPMTVGAMISTLCEKGLGGRVRDTSRKGKPIAFSLTELGRKVAGELGLA